MDTRKYKLWWIILFIPFLMACPWKDNCLDDVAGVEFVDGLMVISPLQDTFKIGDIVSFEVIVPDSFNFGEKRISLIGETSDERPIIRVSQGLFDDTYIDFFSNVLLIQHGERVNKDSAFRLHFCFEDNIYKLRIQLTFEIVGQYRFSRRNDIDFGSQKNCNFYSISTNVKGTEGNFLEFVVIE